MDAKVLRPPAPASYSLVQHSAASPSLLSQPSKAAPESGLPKESIAVHAVGSCLHRCLRHLAGLYATKQLSRTPFGLRPKRVSLAMRQARDACAACQDLMDIVLDLFRQFMSVLIQQQTRAEEEHIDLGPRISYQKIARYFLSSCACAFPQIATDTNKNLRKNAERCD